MKNSLRRFTLIEMLTVVAIIGILAGLIIPVVALSQQRGRITQAKSDIVSISTALKGLESDYNKFVLYKNSAYKIGNQTVATTKVKESDADDAKDKYVRATLKEDTYDAMIAELSVPKNGALTVSVNKRKRVYLEPKSTFNPGADYNTAANKAALWRDPWGHPYVIYLNLDKSGELAIPNTSKVIAADVAIYSFGPNETDDKGCNVDLDTCITSSDSDNHKKHDDVASWAL